MKQFETPEMEVIRFSVMDVITVSNDEFPVDPLNSVGENQLNITKIQ